jgi:hypothetical protein
MCIVHPEISCLEVNGARKQLLTAGIKAETKTSKITITNLNNTTRRKTKPT